ncbi:tetratricopeptide repeat protein [Rubeoparvulum massiliense]|uniref:tetratricopeptide repeat protein n=1 Tax=Rubeoparvulum massiliense TaxID=1631346 RepID=UPI0011CA8A28|nr:tetratricopeptide repeat protein [Rubeoparvulum massiliense]
MLKRIIIVCMILFLSGCNVPQKAGMETIESQGEALFKKEEYKEVLRIYENIPEKNLTENSLYYKAISEIKLDRFKDSIDTFTLLLERAPDYKDLQSIYYNMGYSYYSLDQFQESLDYYHAYFSITQEESALDYIVYHKMVDAYLSLEEYDTAIAVLEEMESKYHSKSLKQGVLERLGNLNVFIHEYTKSIEYYQKYLKLDPDNVHIKIEYCKALIFNGNLDEAEKKLEALLDIPLTNEEKERVTGWLDEIHDERNK